MREGGGCYFPAEVLLCFDCHDSEKLADRKFGVRIKLSRSPLNAIVSLTWRSNHWQFIEGEERRKINSYATIAKNQKPTI